MRSSLYSILLTIHRPSTLRRPSKDRYIDTTASLGIVLHRRILANVSPSHFQNKFPFPILHDKSSFIFQEFEIPNDCYANLIWYEIKQMLLG